MATLCFHLSDQPHYPSAAIQFSVKYTQFFQLLKVVVHRGNQFKVIIQDDRVGHLQEKSPEDVLSSAIAFFLKYDFDAFLAAALDFCLREIEEATSNKTYEAYLWTQRDLTRSDNVVLTEPGIELVSWVLDALLTSKSTLPWKVSEAIILVVKRLRYTLKATNLPLKFLTLHAISAILQKISSAENSELVQRVIRDSKLVFNDFLNAAKQRHSRELVQNRLLFSLYLQAFIEILHVLHHIPCLNTKSTLRALPPNPFVSLSSPLVKPHNNDNATRSLAFDRKRCRSNLLTISDDAISVGYSGNEVWKTVFATESFATGVISWEIQIEKSSSSYIFVGVANSRASCDSFLGADDHSWGYIGDKALYYQRNRVRAYGDNFGEDDCIGVQLDCERGTLSFSKNGVNLGVAFENIVGEVYPAVAFYSRHQRVSFVQDSLVVDQTKLDIPTSATDSKLDESTTPGSIEESIIVCELMASMIDKQSVRQEPLRSAYEMTVQWISGSKKYVTTRAGKPLWVDITCDSCTPFGFQSGERVRTARGNGVVVGVAEQRLWIDVDGEQGAWFFHPSKLRSLTLISINNPSKVLSTTSGSSSSAQDTANGIVDPMIKKIPTKSVNEAHHLDSTISAKLTFEEFEAFVNDTRWSLVIDRELISLVNDFCETSSVSPWNVSPTEMLELFRLKANELETAIGSSMAFFTKPSQETQLVARIGFLRFFNAYFSRVIGYFDLTWHYFSPDSSLLPCKLVSKCRGSIFIALKNEFFTTLMEKTANSPKKADDDYDYPEDLPQVLINRPKAAAAKCHPGSTKSLFLSMFGQAFEELHFLPLKTLRMVYSHPMDDGQLRSFKVKFEGEGVDDYGGPYREFFSQFFAELQMLRSKNDLDPGAQQQRQENTSPEGGSKLVENPTECLLPFLLPSPNWRNGVGANREKFVINAALLRDTPLARNGNQSRVNGNNTMHERNSSSESADLSHETAIEKRQLHGEMLFFLGQMLGTCLRTRVCVRLDLAISVWKHLAGEVETDSADQEEAALQNLKEVDFVAYTLWKSLRAMLSEYQKLQALGVPGNDRRLQGLEEQLEAMDLTFTVFLSDGQIMELCNGGAEKVVTLDNLEAYLTTVIRARMDESKDVLNIIKQGLNSILPVAALSLYTWKELERHTCGVAEVDVNLLKQNTEYDEDVSAQDEFVQRFWRVLASVEEEDKRSFLRFVWARSRLPAGTAQFHQKFKIQSLALASNGGTANGESSGSSNASGGWMDSQLPKSHTCFFALQLPRYSTDEICRKQMLYAIRNCVEMDGDFRLADTEMTGWNDINPNDQLRF
uniref:B30.2/SPRY domain-containing protein n=1 Tax=Globisporangium ultimum (strain ATCC 200006 / CBS 805.95 / DAOM BR144) TaxID=431595 RepID=K3X672_GLOUD